MKMKKEHYKVLEAAIAPKMHEYPKHAYIKGGHSAKRYRWDLLYISGLRIGDGVGMDGLPLYAYLNDDHIDTALRQITGTK